ncbi:MAG: N-acetylmuramoyl-L-alanine amidase [Gemmatimonadetes bacterium]|nr:N-acetylmuramoyl-L-alanine amidase [Gemmatimonadota bacterium]
MPEPKARTLTGCRNFGALREPRIGVMLHYDDSSSDEGAVAWFTDDRCEVSYNYLVLDDGEYVPIVPEDKRAWHAGHCKSSAPNKLRYTDANSAFVAIAIATNAKKAATRPQLDTVVWLTRREFDRNGWPLTDTWRIVGHDQEAIYANKADVPKALRGKRGRKIDPTGPNPARPILSVELVRTRITAG